jgi:hypothetical protein
MNEEITILECEDIGKIKFQIRERTITMDVPFKKDDLISNLIKQIKSMQERIKALERKEVSKIFVTEKSLVREWDNEYDAEWDKY